VGPAARRHQRRTTGASGDGFGRIEVITGGRRRRRWTAEDKAWIVAESHAPATTASAVARRYGLHTGQLFTWRQQLRRRASSPAAIDGPAFVPVLLAEDDRAPAEAVGRMEIVLGPAVVRVAADVDAAALRRVLEVVRGLP
jgi:transposase